MYSCIYILIYSCIHVHICIYIYLYIHVYVNIYIYTHVSLYLYVCSLPRLHVHISKYTGNFGLETIWMIPTLGFVCLLCVSVWILSAVETSMNLKKCAKIVFHSLEWRAAASPLHANTSVSLPTHIHAHPHTHAYTHAHAQIPKSAWRLLLGFECALERPGALWIFRCTCQ